VSLREAAQGGGRSTEGGRVLARNDEVDDGAAVSRVNARATFAPWPRRHVVVGFTFLGCIIAYTDRVNISVAALAMKEHFGWSQTEKGFVLSAFFVGYFLFMFVAGLLATRFGGKRVLGYSVAAWSIFTFLTPLAATLSLAALLVVRVGMGIGEAAMFPATFELFGRWVPPTERARAVARVYSGIPIGTLIGLMGTGWVVGRFGWPMAFYAFGVAGLLWVIAWFQQVQNDPAADRRLGQEERALLLQTGSATGPVDRLPLRRLLLHTTVSALVAAHVATAWSLYVLLSWLPSYFRDVQGLSVANAGLFSAAPWLAMFAVTNLAAVVSDRMIERGWRLTTTRKLMQCVGLVLSAAFLLLIREAHSPAVSLVLMCAATGALGFSWAGFAPSFLDVAPRHGAVLFGFSNTFATIPGIVGVAVTGWLIDVTGTYSAAFVLTAVVSAAGALIFGFLFEARPIVE
jgi:MFS transporter, ACS family, solute carrier family 17 (sodium-dependent inorganic phosphate cotransporter), other